MEGIEIHIPTISILVHLPLHPSKMKEPHGSYLAFLCRFSAYSFRFLMEFPVVWLCKCLFCFNFSIVVSSLLKVILLWKISTQIAVERIPLYSALKMINSWPILFPTLSLYSLHILPHFILKQISDQPKSIFRVQIAHHYTMDDIFSLCGQKTKASPLKYNYSIITSHLKISSNS